jgi:hypothetical protein
MLCRAVREPLRILVPRISLVASASSPHWKTREAFMRNYLILAAGLLLSGCLPMEAQTLATETVLAQTSPSLTLIVLRASRVRLSPIVLPVQLPRKPLPHPAILLAGVYKPETSLETRLPIEEFRTPFLTESSFLVAHLWRGLQLDAVDSTLHSQSLQLGSPRIGSGFQNFRPSSHDQAGITSSSEFDGIRLRYSFGRDSDTRKAIRMWRCVSWAIGNGRGCPLAQ